MDTSSNYAKGMLMKSTMLLRCWKQYGDVRRAMSEGQAVSLWRNSDLFVWIGDQQLLGTVVLSKLLITLSLVNCIFPRSLAYPKMGTHIISYARLQGISNGVQQVHSDLFYESRLQHGHGTALDHGLRVLARQSMEMIKKRWPIIRPSPKGSIYHIFINLPPNPQQKRRAVNRVLTDSTYQWLLT